MPRPKDSKRRLRGGGPRRVTQQDIADVAGVHVMTVSDALSGARSVAPATREKIQTIAAQLNYVPNSAARALSTGRTNIIAILIGAMDEPYYANMAHALEKHLNADGYRMLLMRTPHEVKDMVRATGNASVDGAIAVDMYHLVEEFRLQSSVPCVSIGTFDPPFVDHVIIDLSASVEEAVRLMLANGRKRIAYLVTQPFMAETTEVRARAYQTTLAQEGREPEFISVGTDVFSVARERFRDYLQSHGAPDGLLCQNDETAMIAYRALRDCGHRVPEDTLLVGCDGHRHMEYFDPPLSTIVQPMDELCQAAWSILRKRMADPSLPPQTASFQGQLRITRSLVPRP